jgi:PAS domain-containing protein
LRNNTQISDKKSPCKEITEEWNTGIKEKAYKEFLDSLPEIICEVDCEGYFTYCNKSALEITGYSDKT